METTLRDWLYDPTVARLVTVGVGLVLIAVFVRAARTSLGRYIRDTDTRYRARKFVSFLGYVVAFVFLTVLFRMSADQRRIRSCDLGFGHREA